MEKLPQEEDKYAGPDRDDSRQDRKRSQSIEFSSDEERPQRHNHSRRDKGEHRRHHSAKDRDRKHHHRDKREKPHHPEDPEKEVEAEQDHAGSFPRVKMNSEFYLRY